MQTNKRYVWITPSFRIKNTATLWLVFWKHSLKTIKHVVSEARTETSPYPFCSCVNVSNIHGEISHRKITRCEKVLHQSGSHTSDELFPPPAPQELLRMPQGCSRPKPLAEGWREVRSQLPPAPQPPGAHPGEAKGLETPQDRPRCPF